MCTLFSSRPVSFFSHSIVSEGSEATNVTAHFSWTPRLGCKIGNNLSLDKNWFLCYQMPSHNKVTFLETYVHTNLK